MAEKMYCFNCDKKVIPKQESVKNNYTINDEKFSVLETVYKCSDCGMELISEKLNESLENIYASYLKLNGLKQEDFKNIRKSINLSQDLFAKALGWSKKTITRYENGQSYPQKEYLEVYKKLKSNKDGIINILNSNRIKLGEEYYNILNKIKSSLDVKTINTVLFMLENNPLYETQVMKNLFAIDFYSQKENGHPITTLKYAKAPYGPIIDNEKNILNFLLQNNYLKIIYYNDDLIKFTTAKLYDKNLFTKEELEIMTYIKNKLKNKTSKELSDWSHNFAGWKKTKNGQIIDYSYAKFLDLEKGFK